jgi:hypothetical protein
LAHYLVGLPGAAGARRAMVAVNTLGDVDAVLDGIRAELAARKMEPREPERVLQPA